MKIYYWMDPANAEEYDEVPETEENFLGLELNEKSTPLAVRDYYQFLVECEDKTRTVIHDAKELSKRMIEKFKASKCYLLKTERDRQEIISYLKNNPGTIVSISPNEIIS